MAPLPEGREHVLRFDWTDVAERTARLYGEVLSGRAARVQS